MPTPIRTLLSAACVAALLPASALARYQDAFGSPAVAVSAKAATPSAFRDVKASHPNGDAIEFVRAQGIVGGYPDGTFRPDIRINRAEFVKILMLYKFGQQMIDVCKSAYFRDVPGDGWYANHVCRARDAHLINGYPDGTFGPERFINFSEAAKIIAGTDTFNSGDPSLPAYTGGPWFSIYVTYLAEHAAIPTSIGTADQEITRGEMAEILYRLKANPFKPSQPASVFLGTMPAPDVCTDGPIETKEWGGVTSYPKKKEYAHLDYLGEALTAYDCGDARFRQIYGEDREVGPYPQVRLSSQPSAGLRGLLENQGYACRTDTETTCTYWVHAATVPLSSLIEFRPYAEEIKGFDCPNCYE